jgi:hypothetical protein
LELETIIKTDEFKKAIRDIVREQMSQTYQDMDEIRRSPAGSIIRIEEEIKSIKQNMVTKEDLRALEGRIMTLEGRFEGLEGRFEGRFKGLEGRFKGLEGKINLITGLMFIMLTIYGALIAKLIFFP